MIKKKACFIIGEVAQAHNGSIDIAHDYIESLSKTGVDAVKFQTHIAKSETTIHEPWRVKFSEQDKTRYDYWKRMEFTESQWLELKEHADEVNLKFLSSPFSLEAVDLLNKLDIHAWKIASGEFNNKQMLSSICETGKPIFLSTGMCSMSEIDIDIETIKSLSNSEITLMQCTSKYPTSAEDVGLNMVNEFRERYNCPVGLSDHSGSIYTGIAAVTLGINVLEVHATFSRNEIGPDVTSSLTINEIKEMVDGIKFVESVLANPIDKDKMAEDLKPMRKIFRKSLVYNRKLEKGAKVAKEDLDYKKPGTGLPFEKLENIIGRKLVISVESDDIVSFSHFES